MSIDLLQNKIRKLKNPSALAFAYDPEMVPPGLREGKSPLEGYESYALALLEGLRDILPGVRFGMPGFCLAGPEALGLLQRLLKKARELGYYVLLDIPEGSALAAQSLGQDSDWVYDGLIVSPWLGTDSWKGLIPLCQADKDIFVTVRSANRSAPELQDLITGGRLVHLAAADHVSRQGLTLVGKFGYSRIGAVSPATSADVNRNLRGKYKQMFLLVDGYDLRGANAKNCAAAFDKLGHGALVCAGGSILTAWKEGEGSFLESARKEALRMKKNLTGYFTIL